MKILAQSVVIHERDTVATALKALRAGAKIPVTIKNRHEIIGLLTDIPAGHKFSLIDMEQGNAIIKYGQPIGQSTIKIRRGEHVHTHNLASKKRQR